MPPPPPPRLGAPTNSVTPSGDAATALPKPSPATVSLPVSGPPAATLEFAQAPPHVAVVKRKTRFTPGAPTYSVALSGDTARAAPKRALAAPPG